MQVTACTSFSTATSTEGMPIAATQIDFFCGCVTNAPSEHRRRPTVLLANLFLHYTFDMWMARNYLHIPFERYADDGICHCRSGAGPLACVSGSLRGLQAGAASREDEDRLLQGCEPAGRLSGHCRLLDHLVAACELGRRHGNSERLRRLHGNCQLVLGWCLDRKIQPQNPIGTFSAQADKTATNRKRVISEVLPVALASGSFARVAVVCTTACGSYPRTT
jgi:hypothetical protein